MIFLSTITNRKQNEHSDRYPFSVPVIKHFSKIEFTTPVTYFIGENGSGKSTLLEGIAAGIHHRTIGSQNISEDQTLEGAKKLGDALKFSWKLKTHQGFYLRSEDMFGFSKYLSNEKTEMGKIVEEIDQTSSGYGNQLARGAVLSQIQAFENKYGESLDANSHGETFLKVFQARFRPGGLYLLDEPETPLSFKRQLQLVVMLQEMVKQDAQFIIATHSPILTAMEGVTIFSFDNGKIHETKYEDIEQFQLMKDFLNNPKTFLKHF